MEDLEGSTDGSAPPVDTGDDETAQTESEAGLVDREKWPLGADEEHEKITLSWPKTPVVIIAYWENQFVLPVSTCFQWLRST